MATNPYFQKGLGIGRASEQLVVENTIIEVIRMAGQDFYYVQRTVVSPDPVLNEAPASTFDAAFAIEMYPTNYASFGGMGHQLDPFGLDLGDSLELVVSKRRAFEETHIDTLQAGDLIYWPLMKSFWQINYVDPEKSPFYALSNLYTLTLKCQRFIYNHEVFNTGIPAIDAINGYVSGFGKNTAINEAGDAFIDFADENAEGTIQDPDSNG
jgi:hypothetical protein